MSEEKLIFNRKKTQNKRLGMGLSALLGGIDNIDAFNSKLHSRGEPLDGSTLFVCVDEIPVESIFPNENQPRKCFSEDELANLADSILKNGVLQPILVRKIADENFQIIAGERRYRASKLAKLETVPCIVKNFSDDEVFILAIIENIQRENLNPIEEAEGYFHLIQNMGFTQEKVSEIVGKSRSYVANIVRLSTLPASIKQMVLDGRLTAGHARPLIMLKSEEQMCNIADVTIANNYSTRKVEDLVSSILKESEAIQSTNILNSKEVNKVPEFIGQVSKAFQEKFNISINIKPSKRGGTILFKYKTQQELQNIVDKFGLSEVQ